MGVSTKVGATETARMPWGASSTAIALVSPSTACLDMQYTVCRAAPTWPICEDMLMITPDLRGIIARTAA